LSYKEEIGCWAKVGWQIENLAMLIYKGKDSK
jgi:hypothetical protein